MLLDEVEKDIQRICKAAKAAGHIADYHMDGDNRLTLKFHPVRSARGLEEGGDCSIWYGPITIGDEAPGTVRTNGYIATRPAREVMRFIDSIIYSHYGQ